MEQSEKRRIVEALILSSTEPISAAKLAEIIPYCKTAEARELVQELNGEYIRQNRAFEIWEVAGGYQLRSLPEFASYLQQTQKTRPLRLSQASLETLAVVAYRQPVTRAEIEHIRGVDAGAVLRSLLERKLVRIAGHREVPGRPLLYATSRRFLEVFGLARLEDLPTLRDLEEFAPEAAMPGAENADDADESVAASSEEPAEESVAASSEEPAAEAIAPSGKKPAAKTTAAAPVADDAPVLHVPAE